MNKGYTLIELLIAMVITLFATLVITRFFITEHHVYRVQEAKAEMNQTLRGAMNMFTGELILAGYGIPPSTKKITKFKTDEIEFRTNLRNIRAAFSADSPAGETILSIKGDGKSFEKNDVIIICNNSNYDACEEHILSKDGGSNSLTITGGLGTTFPTGSTVNVMNTISYRYNKTKRELQRKIDRGYWEPVAENVAEDGFSLSYRDKNNNAPLDSSDIHGIDITLTVEGFRRDSYFQENNGYRRGSGTTTVMLRN